MILMSVIQKNLQDRHDLCSAEKRLANARKGQWPEDTQSWIKKNLTHSNWQIRNVAVKLIGEGKFTSFMLDLCACLTNRSEAGFVRRNSAKSLHGYGSVGDQVLTAFFSGLDDPYWEVRTESAMGIALHGRPDCHRANDIIARVYRKDISQISGYPIFWPRRIYREKNFEVRAAMFRALGAIIAVQEQIRALEIPLEEDIWKVREAALEAFVRAAQRLRFTHGHIQAVLSRMDLTCTEFIPTFPIRRTYSVLSEDCALNVCDDEVQKVNDHAV